ncbi:MAG: DUF4190 domain-containing protein [Clostridia bacterium]|nr:DUF4190 domain-containing protein [Clostridia bacterium]MBQ3553832.1 DUF4190 domain-containing protein [Clostridia bacterium]
MFCPKCGSMNEDTAVHCAQCGAQLQEEAAPATIPDLQVNQAPVYQAPAYKAPQAKPEGYGMGIAAMVLGIVSLVFFCVVWLSIPCAIIGLILGVVAMNKAKVQGVKNAMAVAGLVCSCISLAVLVIWFIWIAIVMSAAGGMAGGMMEEAFEDFFYSLR